MLNHNILVPNGYVVTAATFDQFLAETDLKQEIEAALSKVNTKAIHTVEHASENIQSIIKSGKSVVCDRYYQTTLSAYDDEVINLVNSEQIIDKLYKPNFCFLLTVSEEERLKRLKKRGYLSKDDIESIDNKVLRDAQMFKYHQMKMIQIDTTKKSEEDVMNEIFRIMNFQKL